MTLFSDGEKNKKQGTRKIHRKRDFITLMRRVKNGEMFRLKTLKARISKI